MKPLVMLLHLEAFVLAASKLLGAGFDKIQGGYIFQETEYG
jgi:hypothetical protein